MKPYPPLGLLYLCSSLKREGFDVEVFDATFSQPAELSRKLRTKRSSVLGIYANLLTRQAVLEIIRDARAHNWTVVVGGPEPANYPDEFLDYGADVVVIGEGEQTLSELLTMLVAQGPNRLHGLRGTVFRDESGVVVTNPERPQITDLDSLPWPDRASIDHELYLDAWREHHGVGSINLITARGCPYRCRWCSHAVFGYTHRRRSHLDCADELEYIKETYRPEQVWYADDVFTMNHRWLLRYAEELKRRNLRLPFETISRADRMMKEEVLQVLAEMGCFRIWIGSESGSQRILDAMERGVTIDQVHWACQAAKRNGIEVGMFLMWGYQGETVDDIQATVDLVKKCDPDIYFTTVAYPIKNSKYFRDVESDLAPLKPWPTATDRDHRVLSQESQAYYRNAERWLRAEVAASRNEEANPIIARAKRSEALEAQNAMLVELAKGRD